MTMGMMHAGRAVPSPSDSRDGGAMRGRPDRRRDRPRGARRGSLLEIGTAVAASVAMVTLVAGGGILVERTASAASPEAASVAGTSPPRSWHAWIGPGPLPLSWHEPD